MFAHNVMLFQRGIHNPDSLAEFKMFLKKEAKSIVEQSEYYRKQFSMITLVKLRKSYYIV